MEASRVYSVPEQLLGLKQLSKNLWWSWNGEAQALFAELSPRLWSKFNHNPSEVMMNVSEQELTARLADTAFSAQVSHVLKKFYDYLGSNTTWAHTHATEFADHPVAYFSAEFGLHESLPIYSGGLGVLAGDHIKAASDLGLNFVGISLYYREGYFQQRLSPDGWQQELYPLYKPDFLPLDLVTDADGKPIVVSVDLAHSIVHLQGWAVKVGRATLYLLDANLEQNEHHYRDITSRVYGGDSTTRINQEVILGIGGVKFLHALGLRPKVYHMNEGHSAFLTLELLREHIASGKSLTEAKELVKSRCVFTTHTPVPAGHDRFSPDLMDYTFSHFIKSLGIDFDTLMSLGRENPADKLSHFTMTVLCLNLSRAANGVSELHGSVSREMWKHLYGTASPSDVPIGYITNGIHTRSWINDKADAFWRRHADDNEAFFTDANTLAHILAGISDAELWALRYQLRREMIEFVRQRLEEQNLRHGWEMGILYPHTLSPDVLTIGFARRFATYKRAPLIFSDIERISKIINHSERPVQLVFAGKAHPRDNGGKKFIQEIFHITRMPQFLGKVIFLENYDMNVTRHLISGVDVWLNTPMRPLEASGTSGQKVVASGGLNFSILDGWWREAYNGSNGWAIGKDEHLPDQDAQNKLDAAALYDTLEHDLVPMFYERNKGIPTNWIARIRNSMQTLMPVYNTHRMVTEYIEKYYKTNA
ncbi:MAG: alpha-glucan phosphorylase [[Candidatus Thermochlorobacteriaceae] bacterium GBChlB]|nr:MAG: alpha-glucan phosphorylase [[Candidatus Thermochlorobacteriaceae] bacterium GBChlB]